MSATGLLSGLGHIPASHPTMFHPIFIVSVMMFLSMGLSDSASVPISSSPTTIGNNDDADLELIASSKILMDHTPSTDSTFITRAVLKITGELANNIKKDARNDEDVRLEKNVVELIDEHFSSPSGTNSTNAHPVQNEKFFEKSEQERQEEQLGDSSGGKKNERNSYEMSSPLHVARCRATCLQKFSIVKPQNKRSIPATTSDTMSEEVMKMASTSPEEMHLLPLLRLRRRRRSTKSPIITVNENSSSWSCQKDSADCLTCWNSCELFEPKDNNSRRDVSPPDHGFLQKKISEEASGTATPRKTDDDEKKRKRGKQNQLACSSLDSKQCLAGCKEACSFYEQLSPPKGEEQEGSPFKGDPVVATRHESIVKIVPGKITWPTSSHPGQEGDASTVYVVIQEYPDRKWRQIAQTTETSIDIPTGLTSAMSSKLRSVRILVVDPQGLQSVYSPEKSEKVEQETMAVKRSNSRKGTASPSLTTPQAGNNDGGVTEKIALDSTDSSSPANTNDHVESDPVDPSVRSSTPTTASLSSHSGGETTGLSPSTNNDLHVEGPFSFELRVVSLIHQKSLVIAELKWDEIGGNPFQEYLITWELTGGGLKGHLVTDSTSVTLSLWPDTKYQIQVEQFILNLDADGEQPASSGSSTSIRSLPMIVDTREASFPMEKPSALLSSSGEDEEEEEEDDYEDEDVSPHEGNATGGEMESHKSISGGFLNMTLFLAIAISALIFVLVILTVAAFTWTKMRKVSAENGFGDSCNSPMITPTKSSERRHKAYSSSTMEPEPLLTQDDFYWEEYSPVYHPTTAPNSHFSQYASPFDRIGCASLPTTVSVISTSNSSSPGREAPSSYLSYYRGIEASSLSSNMAYSLLSSDPAMMTMTASSKLGCPSLGSSGGLH